VRVLRSLPWQACPLRRPLTRAPRLGAAISVPPRLRRAVCPCAALAPPPPLPRYMQVQVPALQLQSFLRGFVVATANALVTPRARVFRVHDGRAFVLCANRNTATPAEAVTGESTFTFDPTFSEEITEFCSRHSSGNKVAFGSGRNTSCGYGPCSWLQPPEKRSVPRMLICG
jgi:hypothetical protein